METRDCVIVASDDERAELAAALHDAELPVVALSLREAASALATFVPRLVVLDVASVREGSPLAALELARSRPALSDVPVIVTCSGADEDLLARAFELGADDIMRAPIRPSELVMRVRGQLRLHDYVAEVARRERDARVVLELTQALASTLDLRGILFTVVQRIAEVARVDRCSIVLVGDAGGVGYVVAASDDRSVRDLPIHLAKYPEIQRVMETSEVLFVEDASTHPLFDVVRAGLPKDAFRSLALLPILHDDKPLGVMLLRDRKPLGLREHELSLARTVASATAIALRNARILQQLQERTQQISVARVEAERRLRALERYADFFHSAADGIVVVDEDWVILFSNPRAHEILGFGEAEVGKKRLVECFDARDKSVVDGLRLGFAAGVFPTMIDLSIRRKVRAGSLEKRLLSVSFSGLLREESGAVLVSFRDVTAERAIATELRKTKDFLERVIESSVDAIISADRAGVVLLFNRAAERVMGRRADEMVGRANVRDLYPVGEAEHIMQLIRSRELGGPGRVEGYRTHVLDGDGRKVPVELSAAIVYEDGAPSGTVGIFTDLRERLHMETRLSAAQDELRSREKQAVIAELAGAAAHELNQPLTAVLGYAEILRRRAPPDTPMRKTVEALALQAERMAEIVRKIGKITKYETKTYVGGAKILDLDRSTSADDDAFAMTGRSEEASTEGGAPRTDEGEAR